MDATRRVLLITGTAGAGKTAIGQPLERRSGFVFLDGDAIQKRVDFQARRDPAFQVDYHAATLDALRIGLALGYDVVVGYILDREAWRTYAAALAELGITPVFRVLVPDRDVCLQRDLARECWTAGPAWVDRWYEVMRSYRTTHAPLCIDNSRETPEETFERHFEALLSERIL